MATVPVSIVAARQRWQGRQWRRADGGESGYGDGEEGKGRWDGGGGLGGVVMETVTTVAALVVVAA